MLDARRTGLAEGAATLLSSHAEHPRPATSDTTKGSQATPADSLKESQLAARSGPSPRHRTSPTHRIQTASLKAGTPGTQEDRACVVRSRSSMTAVLSGASGGRQRGSRDKFTARVALSLLDLDEALGVYVLRGDADLGEGCDAGVDRCRGAAQEEVPPREGVGSVALE